MSAVFCIQQGQHLESGRRRAKLRETYDYAICLARQNLRQPRRLGTFSDSDQGALDFGIRFHRSLDLFGRNAVTMEVGVRDCDDLLPPLVRVSKLASCDQESGIRTK